MKRLLTILFVVFSCVALEAQVTPNASMTTDAGCDCKVLDTLINYKRTLKADTAYCLGYTRVVQGGELVIPAGTKLFGLKAVKGTLTIERGGKITAKGSKIAPIVMTSDQAPNSRKRGDWGGVIICGKAKLHAAGSGAIGRDTMAIEGTFGRPDIYGGGNDDNDNSGILTYVQIHYGGINVGAAGSGNELNSLTMYGVGRGTTIKYVQTSYGQDDAFEWFGGTVNCSYLVSLNTQDDDLDCDAGYTGTVQYALVVRTDSSSYDPDPSNAFECDNDATGSASEPITAPVFSNVTCFGPFTNYTNGASGQASQSGANAVRLRRNSAVSIYNSIFSGYRNGLRMEGSGTINRANDDRDTTIGTRFEYNILHNMVTTTLASDDADWSDNSLNGSSNNMASSITEWFYAYMAGNAVVPGNLSNLGTPSSLLSANWCSNPPAASAWKLDINYKAPAVPTFYVALIKSGSGFGINADLDTAVAKLRMKRTNTRGAAAGATGFDGWVDWCPQSSEYCVGGSIPSNGNPTGATEVFNTEAGLNIYPNPAINTTNVEFELNNNANVQVKVVALDGKEMSNTVFNGQMEAGVNNVKLNTSTLAKGMYVVKVSNGAKELSSLIVVE
jgi:hypothetical protein